MLKPPASLQGRLLRLVLGMVAGVWLATAALTWFDMRRALDELFDGHLAQAASLLVVQQVRKVGDDEGDDERGVDTPTLHRNAPQVAFQVFREGRLALRSANAPAAPMVAAGERFQPGLHSVTIDGDAWRVFAARGAERDVRVFVGERAASRAAIVWAALRSTLWPMLAALPLLALALWWAVRSGVAPLRRLGRNLAERQAQALHAVVVEGAPAEMLPMLDALNALLKRIAGLMEAERRFTADAAHELRTPIAAIRAQAQVALAEADDSARRHALEATLAGCDRATRLVEQMLTLSRLEAGAATPMASVELGALARRVLADAAPLALARQQALELDAAEPCPVQGDATLIAVLLRNLVDNAIRYSPPRANIRVALTRQPAGGVRLAVEDSGAGLGEADLARLGERFFRIVGSGQSGSGLGWSIVRRIAAVHRATIQVGRSSALGGLAVTIDWPA